MITAKLIGGDALRKKFDAIGDQADEVFKEVVDDTALHIHSKAVGYIGQNVKTGTGHLKQSMYVDLSGSDFALVGNRAEYAPYVEFGTGPLSRFPPEFADIAASVQSRVTDKLPEALQKIRDWLKMRGYDVKNAYPMLINKLKLGERPKPFMYPAYLSGKKYIIKEADKAIKKLVKLK